MAVLRRDLENLIIVPTHGVYVGGLRGDSDDDNQWEGIFPGEAKLLTEHALVGAAELIRDKKALLLFSGGQTRPGAGPLAEGVSYWQIAKSKEGLSTEDLEERAATEDYAKDSVSHIPYCISRFEHIENRKPGHITVCGWKFKEERFMMHAEIANWSLEDFTYIGVNNPEGDPADEKSPIAMALKGEQLAIKEYKKFPSGNSDELNAKRGNRNPQFTHHTPYGNAYRHVETFR